MELASMVQVAARASTTFRVWPTQVAASLLVPGMHVLQDTSEPEHFPRACVLAFSPSWCYDVSMHRRRLSVTGARRRREHGRLCAGAAAGDPLLNYTPFN